MVLSTLVLGFAVCGLEMRKPFTDSETAVLHQGGISSFPCCARQKRVSTSVERGFRMGGSQSMAQLSILSVLRRLRCGDVRQMKEVNTRGCTNRLFKFTCEKTNLFVKVNDLYTATQMFEGEAAGLKAMRFAGQSTPNPLRIGDLPDGGSYLIMEYLDLDPIELVNPTFQNLLGCNLAKMHLHQSDRHSLFGFGVESQAGLAAADNTWTSGWANFFVSRRLRPALDALRHRWGLNPSAANAAAQAAAAYTGSGDCSLSKVEAAVERLLGSVEEICLRATELLEGAGEVRPSILHGDLWLGNAGVTLSGGTVMFDPACFYGHSEYDLAMENWPARDGLPGFGQSFYQGYHSVLPRLPGHAERRLVYQLSMLLGRAAAAASSSSSAAAAAAAEGVGGNTKLQRLGSAPRGVAAEGKEAQYLTLAADLAERLMQDGNGLYV